MLTFRQPKEIESVFMAAIRGSETRRKKYVVRVICILSTLYFFCACWEAALRLTAHMPIWNAILSMPNLPDLRCPSTGQSLDPGFNGTTIGAVLTEYFLSTFHFWGLGLVSIGSRRQMRGLSFFRTFTTPLVIFLGRQLPTGRPSINSSIAIISGLRRPHRWRAMSLMVVVDCLAAVNTIACPKGVTTVQRRLTELAFAGGFEKQLSSMSPPAAFSATEVQKKVPQ